MSDVNKLDDKQCPFDLDKYKNNDNDVVAPIGSLPWAIIQVYMGEVVVRSKWETSREYIGLTVKSPKSASHIEKHDKYGSSHWQPTPDDLMACDWELKPIEGMLSFDLKVGHASDNWGYLGDDEWANMGTEGILPFGTLTNLQNKTDINKFSLFIWGEHNSDVLIRVSSDTNGEAYQKIVDLFAKYLTVTVAGIPYHLGSSSGNYTLYGQEAYEFTGQYIHRDARKLGDLLKQNVGKTLSFCFDWR
ncbi:Thoeris anti-defense Tad2 family protein [Xenorhabdus innexi]|uniref:Uncharacterized protein n=1 Tax=Xenorhabdus innexi TaxID=290109 RepID=A0A1N6MQ32_9GAMM|nr:MW1434 family type I TA system toxin [Xenorhabdus innexi]PHM25100.1 hypothetical protein Xinn_04054 [Xenorhabdus innexi]SIP70963.1 conserved hypothetical protein [Xenorhabdus innexi]